MGHSFLSALVLLLVIHPCCSPPIIVSAIRNVAPLRRTGWHWMGIAVAGPVLITVAWELMLAGPKRFFDPN